MSMRINFTNCVSHCTRLLFWVACGFLTLNVTQVYAQGQTISGKVTSAESGEPLPGVNVIVKGTTTGTVTDVDGNYRLNVPADADILSYTFIGLKAKEAAIEGRSVIDVVMESDVTELSEIVVTGQGSGISKKRLATTVDVVSSEDLANTPMVRIDQVLQSKLPNTQIQLSSGQPGTTSIIRTRGIASALVSTTPIIYVDGVRVDNLNTASALSNDTGGAQSSTLADLPIENIERVEFVKGGAATTLYGADAANGVIQIFTKKGQAGAARVTFETQMGAIEGTSDYFKFDQTGELAFRTGFLQSHRIGVNGGNENVTYTFSGNIYNDNGFQEAIDNTRFSLRNSINAQLSPKFNYFGSLGFTNNQFTRLPNANNSRDVYYGVDQGGFGDPNEWDENPENREEAIRVQEATSDLYDLTEAVSRFTTSHNFTYNPIEEVTIKAVIGLDSRNSRTQEILTNAYQIAIGEVPEGTVDQGTIDNYTRNFLSTTGSLTAQYEASLNDFSFITVVGGQFFRNDDRQINAAASNVVEGSQSINNAADNTAEDFIYTVTNYGYFAKENIGFLDRYFVDFGFRIDYNTGFGSNVGGQFFPSVGASYVLSDEPFFTNAIPTSVISTLKLRATYGEAGNFPPPFARDPQINANPYLGGTAFQPGQPGDPNLKPERVQTLEFGGDLSLLDDRIGVGITYYDQKTTDALFTAPYAPSTGDENQTRNLGEISNKGFEISTNFLVLNSESWTMNIGASINTVENEVLSTGGAPEFNLGGFLFLGPFVKEGLPVGYLRGSKPTFGPNGELASVEENANLGNPIPKGFGNLSLNATYKNRLSLYIGGDYQYGSQSVNVNEVLRFFNGVADDRVPEASSDPNQFFNLAGVWIEDADFLKIRNITLTYTLPSQILENVFSNISVSFSALNPLNFYSATNFDPEITGSGARATLPGTNTSAQNLVNIGAFGYGTFSQPRQYLGTLKLTF